MRLSYSGWKTWDTCAKKYHYSYDLKLPRKPMDHDSPAARGTRIHGSIDKYLEGKADAVHPEIQKKYGLWFQGLRDADHELLPEHKFAFTPDWEPTQFNSPGAAWRGLLDLYVKPDIEIFEWKTGGIYDEHEYQAELYGLTALTLHPNLPQVTITNVYFDKYKTKKRTYSQVDLGGLQAMWTQRRQDVIQDTIRPENPGWYCRYCDYSKRNDGPCRF